jgi:hypothetical protein
LRSSLSSALRAFLFGAPRNANKISAAPHLESKLR